MSEIRMIVDRLHEAFNARRFEALNEVLDEDVVLVVEGTSLRGLPATRDYLSGMMSQIPLSVETERVLVDSGDTMVSLTRCLDTSLAPSERVAHGGWTYLVVHRIAAGRIVEWRTYLDAAPVDEGSDDNRARLAGIHRLVGEQAALRRVATLVARSAAQSEVFDAVVSEAAELFGEETWLLRFDPDGSVTLLADNVERGARGPISLMASRDAALASVLGSGLPLRIDDYSVLTGTAPGIARELGVAAAVAAPLIVQGALWGALMLISRGAPLAAGIEDRLAQFADLAATAIANAESRAALTASRARIVASADEARRRLARDVHDGAQQRLVYALIMLKQLKDALQGSDAAVVGLLDESLAQAEAANVQLRELARGIMPAALARGGLRAGVRSLLDHITLPADADVLAGRLPEPVETTGYFVIAEALTNVVKHAGADRARVSALVSGDRLEVEVSDDGLGGADPAGGSGLIGLADRVEAAGGTMSLSSPPGAGTKLIVTLPIDQAQMHERR